MQTDFNAELHARPSIYFSGVALVEHIAVLADAVDGIKHGNIVHVGGAEDRPSTTQIEFHTEFVTVTRVTPLDGVPGSWPMEKLPTSEALRLSGTKEGSLVCRVEVLVRQDTLSDPSSLLKELGFGDTAASSIGGGAARVCSDFKVKGTRGSRILLINRELNAYRLGRMVRRLCEIETYRAMALLALPEARRLAPLLATWDQELAELARRNMNAGSDGHKLILDSISALSARIVSAAADTRTRFGATSAYAKIVDERIGELRELHVPGFQRFGVFVGRRFKPAVRSCEAAAQRLEQMSQATTHLIGLLQTRIQVEVEMQNTLQLQAVADRTAAQVRIQRAVEGLSAIAIAYYLIGLLKAGVEALDATGIHVPAVAKLVAIPIAIVAVIWAMMHVRKALSSTHAGGH